KESDARLFLVGTEGGLLHRLKKENPEKEFYILSPGLVCPNMKRTRLESVLRTMEGMRNIITIPEQVRVKARRALERMLAV
ncbi:MAG: quinolinate synthase NadA, partial [Chloroflexota bacterium]